MKKLYETVTIPKPSSAPDTPAPRRSQAEIEKDKRERQEERENRQVLKKRQVPPYFESELGRAFLISNSAGTLYTIFVSYILLDMLVKLRSLSLTTPLSPLQTEVSMCLDVCFLHYWTLYQIGLCGNPVFSFFRHTL